MRQHTSWRMTKYTLPDTTTKLLRKNISSSLHRQINATSNIFIGGDTAYNYNASKAQIDPQETLTTPQHIQYRHRMTGIVIHEFL